MRFYKVAKENTIVCPSGRHLQSASTSTSRAAPKPRPPIDCFNVVLEAPAENHFANLENLCISTLDQPCSVFERECFRDFVLSFPSCDSTKDISLNLHVFVVVEKVTGVRRNLSPRGVFRGLATNELEMEMLFDPTPEGPTSLHFAPRNQFEKAAQLVLGTRQGRDFSIATHKRDRPGLGLTIPTPVGAAYLVVVQLRPGGSCEVHRDACHVTTGELRTGTLCIMDLRHLWVADLKYPFHTISFVIPQSMLDELTDDLGHPRIRMLECPLSAEREDWIMLNLAKALYPVLETPHASSALATTHLFEAATAHLAQVYGGVAPHAFDSISGLAAWQIRRAKEMLGDDLNTDPTLGDVSAECGLPSFRFAKAFKASLGIPPHRWLMNRRIDSAKNLLAWTAQSRESIARFCGFADLAHFDGVFRRLVGTPPDRWRNDRRL